MTDHTASRATPVLSILIPTIEERKEQCSKLLERLNKLSEPYGEYVEIISICDNKEMSIGEKRQLLHESASGDYIFSLDDDDDIDDDFIPLIFNALCADIDDLFIPDCITFEERINIDGRIQTSNHSLKYDSWQDGVDGFDYVRTPFFKSVIRRDIALQVPVKPMRYSEDADWAARIYPLLHTEVHIQKELYYYTHVSSPFNERYGITQTQ